MASDAAVRQEETDGRRTGSVGRWSECSRCIKAGNSALLLTSPQPRYQRLRMQSARVDMSAMHKKKQNNPSKPELYFFFSQTGVVDGVASKPSERDTRAYAHKRYLPSDLLMSLIRRRQKDFCAAGAISAHEAARLPRIKQEVKWKVFEFKEWIVICNTSKKVFRFSLFFFVIE